MHKIILYILLEQRRVFTLPERNEVTVGEVANFTCGAFGSFIAIFWQFSNSLLNCNESGCDNIDAFVREQIISYSDVNGNITVESTLQIITNGLSPSNFVVACVIIQDAPVGGGSPDSVFSTLLILNDAGILCMHGYTIIVMTSHVHIIHAEAHTISASTSNVTLFTEEGMFSDTVNTQTHASGTHV